MKNHLIVKKIVSAIVLLLLIVFIIDIALNWDDVVRGFNDGYNAARE